MSPRPALDIALALALLAVGLPAASAQTNDVPNVVGFCELQENCLGLSRDGNASGWIAVSATGDADGGQLAVSGTGDADGLFAASGTGDAYATTLAASTTGQADGQFAASGTEEADGGLVGASATGPATGHLSVSALDDADGCHEDHWAPCESLTTDDLFETNLPEDPEHVLD